MNRYNGYLAIFYQVSGRVPKMAANIRLSKNSDIWQKVQPSLLTQRQRTTSGKRLINTVFWYALSNKTKFCILP